MEGEGSRGRQIGLSSTTKVNIYPLITQPTQKTKTGRQGRDGNRGMWRLDGNEINRTKNGGRRTAKEEEEKETNKKEKGL